MGMKFNKGGHKVEIDNGVVRVDGKEMSDVEASRLTGGTISVGNKGPVNTGGRQINDGDWSDGWGW